MKSSSLDGIEYNFLYSPPQSLKKKSSLTTRKAQREFASWQKKNIFLFVFHFENLEKIETFAMLIYYIFLRNFYRINILT